MTARPVKAICRQPSGAGTALQQRGKLSDRLECGTWKRKTGNQSRCSSKKVFGWTNWRFRGTLSKLADCVKVEFDDDKHIEDDLMPKRKDDLKFAPPPGLTWADVDAALKAGEVEGVPAGTDLEEFIWQTIPESRFEIAARNPGRTFTLASWGMRASDLSDDGE